MVRWARAAPAAVSNMDVLVTEAVLISLDELFCSVHKLSEVVAKDSVENDKISRSEVHK